MYIYWLAPVNGFLIEQLLKIGSSFGKELATIDEFFDSIGTFSAVDLLQMAHAKQIYSIAFSLNFRTEN